MTPHPQRCETCTKTNCYHHEEYYRKVALWSLNDHKREWAFTVKYGCASHSSAQSEQVYIIGDSHGRKCNSDCPEKTSNCQDTCKDYYFRNQSTGQEEVTIPMEISSEQEIWEKMLDELDVYAEACRSENETRGRSEKEEIIVSALAGAALAFEGMRVKIAELRKGEP